MGERGGDSELRMRGSGMSAESAADKDVSYEIVASSHCKKMIVKSSNNSCAFDGFLPMRYSDIMRMQICSNMKTEVYSPMPTKSSTKPFPSG